MKKAVILHGTGSNHTKNWFPWLRSELEDLNYEVWVPDLPEAENPNVDRYNKFLLDSDWDFSNNLIIGHSSGSVEILGLLEVLPDDVNIDIAILVGTFRGSLGRQDLEGVSKDFDFERIKSKANKFIVIHSDDDPYCPLEGAEYIANKLGVKVHLMHKMSHFSHSLDLRFNKFPELLDIIKEEIGNTKVAV